MSLSLNSCIEIEPLLDAYHDGELETGQRMQVETHLGQCLSCQRQLAAIKQLVLSLRSLPQLRPQRDMVSNIDDLIISRPGKLVSGPFAWGALSVAAAVCLILIGVKFEDLAQQRLAQDHTPRPKSITQKPAVQSPTSPTIVMKPAEHQPSSRPRRQPQLPDAGAHDAGRAARILEIASLVEDDRSTITESIGLATDEDGLYALKM